MRQLRRSSRLDKQINQQRDDECDDQRHHVFDAIVLEYRERRTAIELVFRHRVPPQIVSATSNKTTKNEPTAFRTPTTLPITSGCPPAWRIDAIVICMPRPTRPNVKNQAM